MAESSFQNRPRHQRHRHNRDLGRNILRGKPPAPPPSPRRNRPYRPPAAGGEVFGVPAKDFSVLAERIPPHLVAEMLRAIQHPLGPRGRMIEIECERGGAIMALGQSEPFAYPAEDWEPGVVSRRGTDVRLVIINAKRPGAGAFRRLIEGIRGAGLNPVVVCPFDHMLAILQHLGWSMTVVDGDDEWRPAKEKTCTPNP